MRTFGMRGAALALLAGFVLVSFVMAQDDSEPTIVIEEMIHQLGEQYERETFSHKFKVKNTGKADLLIEQVKPG